MEWFGKFRAAVICAGATTLMVLVFWFLHMPENYLPKDTVVLVPGHVVPDAQEGVPNRVTFAYTEEMASKSKSDDYRIALQMNHQIAAVYFDNELFFEYKISNERRLSSLVYTSFIFSRNPREASVEFTSYYGRYVKTVYPIYFGDREAIYQSKRAVSAVKFAFFGLMAVSFFSILIYVLIFLRRSEFSLYYIPIALFLLFAGIFVAMDTYSISYVFSNSPDLSNINPTASFSFWQHFTQYIMPIPLFLFAMLQAKRTAWKMFLFVTAYFAVLLIFTTFLDVTFTMFLISFEEYFGVGMMVGFAILLYWSVTRLERKGWVYPYFISLLLIASIVDYVCYRLSLPIEDYRLVKSFLMVACTLWAVDTMRRMLTTRHQIRLKREITEVVTANVLENYEQLDRHVQQMRKIKHDLINHYQSVLLLYRQNEHEKALKYLEKLGETVAEATPRGIQNILIDSIVYNKLTQAQDIRVETDITVPRELPYEDSDVCSLLVNILDNALESCALCQDAWIALRIFVSSNQLFIRCKNSKNRSVVITNGVIQTGKIPRQGHGYGLSIISGVAERYGGTLRVDYDEEYFLVDVAMPLELS